jgi:hypothetical protein
MSKIELGDNLAFVSVIFMIGLVLCFGMYQLRACNESERQANEDCVRSGGDPLRCCTATRSSPNHSCKELRLEK